MIECSNCGTSQFLQITNSRIYFEQTDDADTLTEITERYECTNCGGSGMLTVSEDSECVTGDVEENGQRPTAYLGGVLP